MKPILEPIPLGNQKSILGFCFDKKDFETPWHFHPQHELTYIEESVGTKFIGDYVGGYQPGELVLLRSNLPHCWKNNTSQASNSKSYVVQWNLGIFPEVPELDSIHQLLKTASRGLIFDKEQVNHLIPLIKTFPDLSGQELYIQLLGILSALSKASYNTLSAASFTDDIPSEYGTRMAKIHDFVGENFGRKIYLKELADLVNLSEQSFSRFFTKMMGRPFFTFLNEYRINHAARMLLDTEEPIAQIAYACGYDSLPFFHKKFNESYQVSPAQYRKQFFQKS
ncbi:helix-turn-helix domain-containing protein [Algoriphagus lutimaris]|uniref:AraC family transcriptional regulator n=1 Tax=Algoriphagus lutimaris TaxID=613197 RepID=UPI00196AE564|nr:AraC family transcriptional regulator [Algoriphagus lutimaris]MBN3520706.1 helix-turn-helix domain-containing protein [Algoriphagus lutimaris]